MANGFNDPTHRVLSLDLIEDPLVKVYRSVQPMLIDGESDANVTASFRNLISSAKSLDDDKNAERKKIAW